MATDANDLGAMIGSTLGRVAREATHSVSGNGHGAGLRNGSGPLSGMRGIVAGAALAAAAPLAAKGASKVVRSAATKKIGSATEGVKGAVGDTVGKAIDAPSLAKKVGGKLLPGGGAEGGGKDQKGTPGVGKGRPVQQAVDIGVPLSVAYNQWTQFEEWPQFVHRLDQVTQEEDAKVSFKTKIWGFSKEFVADIVEQRPDERIQWEVSQGVTHRGVVTFHELAPRLTRVQVSLDVEPGSLLHKAARGRRHVKRAVRADLTRFKAFLEMEETETGAWRGEIRDGEVVTKRSGGGSSSSGRQSRSGEHGGRSRGSSSSRKRSSRS
jgi:uncharacterized membrane protein